jgi:hypothetical protein
MVPDPIRLLAATSPGWRWKLPSEAITEWGIPEGMTSTSISSSQNGIPRSCGPVLGKTLILNVKIMMQVTRN